MIFKLYHSNLLKGKLFNLLLCISTINKKKNAYSLSFYSRIKEIKKMSKEVELCRNQN